MTATDKIHKYNKTEESIITLLSLTTQITQSYDSIFDNEDILNSDFENFKGNYHELINDTIYDALASQIILKTIAYLDEWNNYFGVQTELKDKDRILYVKKIAKPAYSLLKEWKDLNDYRNHALAHNHRDREKQNIYLNNKKYDIPGSNGELMLLCYCVNKISQVVAEFFQDEVIAIISIISDIMVKNKIEKSESITFKSKYIEKIRNMNDTIADELMRKSVYESFIYGIINKKT